MSERLYFHLTSHECPTLSAKIIHVIVRLTRAPHDFFRPMVEDFITYENKAKRKEKIVTKGGNAIDLDRV